VRDQEGVTVLVTTHLMEEAEHCNRLAIMDRGRLIACDTPAALKDRVGGDVITLASDRAPELKSEIHSRFGVDATEVEGSLRIERDRGHEFIPQLVEAFPGMIRSVSLGKPTLEDVFIHATGRQFRPMEDAADTADTKTQAGRPRKR
jgi:ABC-2 type transport system ATP-binding protein